MSGNTVLLWSSLGAMAVLSLGLVIAVIRLCLGPTLADRILALDLITTLGMGLIVSFAVYSGVTLYLDIAIGLGLVGFLSTVAFARYLASSIAPLQPAQPPVKP